MPLNEFGFEIPTLDEIVEDIGNRQKLIFPDLNTSPSTPDGQLNGLLAEALMVAFENNLAIYSGLDPSTAEGVMLDRVCSITGIYRKKGFPSIAYLKLSGVPGTLVPNGTLFSDSNEPKNTYTLVEDVTIESSGSVNGTANSLKDGPYFSDANEITVIETPINGLGSVTNPLPVTTGRETESDFDLRIRRYKSVALPGTSLVDSVYAEIMNIDTVIDCAVYENVQNADDSNGIPPHSIFPVVYGGTDDDVADAIMRSKSLGCGLHGSTSVDWKDIQGFTHTVNFQRPTFVPIFINVEVIVDTFDESVIEDVKDRIIDYVNDVRTNSVTCSFGRLLISDDIYASSFYFPFNDAYYSIANILVGDTTPGDSNIVVIGIDEISSFSRDNITVVEYSGTP